MRTRREDWDRISPEDVAWVIEWQLAARFPRVPLGSGPRVSAADLPEPDRRWWNVTLHAGDARVTFPVPLRDLAKAVAWCHGVRARPELFRPPHTIRGSLLALRAALRGGLGSLDPLVHMGYVRLSHEARERGGTRGQR